MATKRQSKSRDPIVEWRASRKAWGSATARLSSLRRLSDDDRDRLGAGMRLIVWQAAEQLRAAAEALLPLARGDQRATLRRLSQRLPLHVTRLCTTDDGDPLSFAPLEDVDAVVPDLRGAFRGRSVPDNYVNVLKALPSSKSQLPAHSQADIAKKICIDKATVSRAIKHWRADGAVHKTELRRTVKGDSKV